MTEEPFACYYKNMTIKCFIMRTDFEPELGRAQRVQVLLNSENELPTASSIEKAKNDLWQDIELGNVFCENDDAQGLFANLPDEIIETLPYEWALKPFSDLKPENCPDYDIIAAGIKKAGFILS